VVKATLRPQLPGKRPGTQCTGGWVDLGTRVDGFGKLRPNGVQTTDPPARSQSPTDRQIRFINNLLSNKNTIKHDCDVTYRKTMRGLWHITCFGLNQPSSSSSSSSSSRWRPVCDLPHYSQCWTSNFKMASCPVPTTEWRDVVIPPHLHIPVSKRNTDSFWLPSNTTMYILIYCDNMSNVWCLMSASRPVTLSPRKYSIAIHTLCRPFEFVIHSAVPSRRYIKNTRRKATLKHQWSCNVRPKRSLKGALSFQVSHIPP